MAELKQKEEEHPIEIQETEVYQCIKERRSIRKYKDKHVEWDKIGTILDSGRWAPTAGNLQNWKAIVITELEERRKIAEACLQQRWMETAPVILVIIGDPDRAEMLYGSRGFRLYTIQNTAAVATNMMLTATSLGLGTCWVGAFDEDMVRRLLNYPEFYHCHVILTLGYADEKPPLQPRNRIETQVYFGAFLAKRRHAPMGYYSIEVEKRARRGLKKIKDLAKKITGEGEN